MKKIHFLSAIIIFLLGSGFIQAQWIEPAQYQQMLGRGMDVDWWTRHQNYSQQDLQHAIADFNDAGIQHIRITLTKDYLSPEDFDILDEQLNQCISYGVTPIIAYKPANVRSYLGYENRISNWWRIVAEHYRNYPACLSFDIILEPNNPMFASYSTLNDFYENCVTVIRRSNPYRIIFIAPIDNSNPLNLQYLRIPSRANGYLMAEWHFFSEPNYSHVWYNWQKHRTYEERLINRRIEAALAWQAKTGIYTWVGGWTPGSCLKTSYSSMQDAFTVFLCNALVRASIPFSVHGINHYYDYNKRVWHHTAYRNMQTIFPTGNFAHSGRLVDHPHLNTGFYIGGKRFDNSSQHNNSVSTYQQGNYNNRAGQQDNHNSGFNIGNDQNSSKNYNNNFNNGRIHSGGNGRYNDKNNVVTNNSNNNPNNNSYYSENYSPSHQSSGGFSRNRVSQDKSGYQSTSLQPIQVRQQSNPFRNNTGNSSSRHEVPTTRKSGKNGRQQNSSYSNTPQQKNGEKQSAPSERNGGGGFSRN